MESYVKLHLGYVALKHLKMDHKRFPFWEDAYKIFYQDLVWSPNPLAGVSLWEYDVRAGCKGIINKKRWFKERVRQACN